MWHIFHQQIKFLQNNFLPCTDIDWWFWSRSEFLNYLFSILWGESDYYSVALEANWKEGGGRFINKVDKQKKGGVGMVLYLW